MLDVLAPETTIVARLTGRLPADVPVLTATDLDGVTEQAQRLPAVFVLFDSLAPVDRLPDAVLVTVSWSIVIAVRNGNSLYGADARREAGPLLATVLLALHGFDLGPDWSPLDLAEGSPPLYDDGAAYFPVSFTTNGAVADE